MYKIGEPAYIIVVLFVIADIFNRFTQLYLLKRVYPTFSVLRFVRDAYYRPGVVFMFMLLFSLIYSHIYMANHIQHVGGILLVLMITALLCFQVGLYKNERVKILTEIRKRI